MFPFFETNENADFLEDGAPCYRAKTMKYCFLITMYI